MQAIHRFAKLILVVFIAIYSMQVYATHIVGGDFYYKKLGGNKYKVTLRLYLDCENGEAGAIKSDEVAIVSLWNAGNNNLLDSFHFKRGNPTRLNKLHYKCLIPPQDICVDEYVYVRELDLDPGKDGIILAFQRCCRNNTITNIVTPESTGATYWVKIPGTNTTTYNSSAVFKELPPNYICTDAPLKFDHSAVDPDGDSLVYELYQPYLGASKDDPRPNNSALNGYFEAPPFRTIYWKSPYFTENQVAGDPVLQIDSKTGELILTPNTVGQFVIGIKVKEYRDGKFIGETLRDYQMNVKKCQFDLVSAFSTTTYSCSDTVKFTNKSYKAAKYRWDFGDPTTDADTSNEVNPTYVYPEDGNYIVTLHAENEICEDDFIFEVKVRSKIEFDLGPDIHFCKDVDAYLSAKKWDATKVQWNNGKFGNTIRVRQTGKYIASVYYGNCVGTDSIEIFKDPVIINLTPDSLFCEYEEVDMIADAGVSGLHYRWSTSPYDTFQTLHITDTGTYRVQVRNEHCQVVDTIRVYLKTLPEIGDYYFVCNEFEKDLDPGEIPEATYLWSDGDTARIKKINKEGTYWVQVTQRQCVTTDTIVVDNPVIELDLGLDSNYCDSLYRKMKAPMDMASYLWHDGSNQPYYITQNPGKFFVYVVDTNGCEKSDTLNLTMTNSPQFELGNDTSICLRSTATYGFENENYQYYWSNGSNDPFVETRDSGWLFLQVVDENGCSAKDSVHISIDVNALPNELFIPNAFTPNGDGLNEYFPFSEYINQPEYRVRVFNRWGQKVFDSDIDPTQYWDATFLEERVAPQAFMYLVDYRGCDGVNHKKSGTVTVLE